MAITPNFCARCGHPVETKMIDKRMRKICPSCGTILYQNPLPVAAAVVLNDERQVLLVKRKNEPHKGMWCLPTGFAELEETIAEAALRELFEETGVTGRVVRLLASDSLRSEFYGDLLIVTFEVEKAGGTERPGDDTDEVTYFPFEKLPPLAFEPNHTAIKICAEIHKDEWAIKDSFLSLQTDSGKEMLSDALVSIIRDHASDIATLWLADVRTNPTTTSYAKYPAEPLHATAYTALTHFSKWLSGSEADEDVRQFYRDVGAERKKSGFDLHELISALTLLRKHIWNFARGTGMWERPIDAYRVLELDRRIVVFFDKAMYHTARGYIEKE